MAYIGRGIENFSQIEVLDLITFTGSVGPYNITKDSVAFVPSTVNSLLIEVDGIIQAPASYTISTSTITFGVSMPSTSTMNSMIHFGTGLITVPADASVTSAKIADDAVTTAKILDNNVTVAKLPTTLNISSNTVTLPASVSGLGTGITNAQLAGSITDAKITGLSSSKLSGIVPVANLGTGTASSSTILYGDQTYKAEPTTDLTPLRQDIITLALKQGVQENMTKHNLPSSAIVTFQADADFNLAGSTDIERNTSKYIWAATDSSSTVNFAPPLKQISTRTGAVATSSWTGGGVTNDSLRDGAGSYAGATVDYGWDLSSDWRWRGWVTDSSNTGNAAGGNFQGGSLLITTDTSKAAGTTPTDLWASAGSSSYYSMSPSDWAARLNSTYATTISASSLTDHDANGTANRSIDLNSAGGVVRHYWNSGTDYGGWDFTHTSSTNTITMKIFTGSSFTSISSDGQVTITEVPSTGRAYINFGDANGITRYWATTHNGGDVATDYSSAVTGSIVVNATGTALGTTNVPTSAVTEVSGVMLMKNAYGTNTLGTDVKVYFTADNSNWTEAASYTDAGTFSDTTKQITLGKTTVTSGSDVRWKIVYANQVADTKVAYIYGIGTNY